MNKQLLFNALYLCNSAFEIDSVDSSDPLHLQVFKEFPQRTCGRKLDMPEFACKTQIQEVR